MRIIRLERVVRTYGAHRVFGPLDLTVHGRDRIGLIGPNGSGKSSLIKIMAGERPDEGRVLLSKNIRIGYLKQELSASNETTLYEFAIEGFKHLERVEAALKQLEEMMAADDVQQDPDRLASTLARYEQLTEAYREDGGFEQQSRTEAALIGLGFTKEQFETPFMVLSGGERARAQMAQVLLSRPQLLLLDEPTNHLDIESTVWLQDNLRKYDRAMVLISHDAHLLRAVTNQTWDIVGGHVTTYRASYDAAINLRAEAREQQQKAVQEDASEREKLEAYIRKYRAGNRASQAQSRAKRLARMEEPEDILPRVPTAVLRLPEAPRSERAVCLMSGVTLGYGDKHIISNVDLEVIRGQRIGIAGPNGSGKSTLLKAIAELLQPISGVVHVGRGVLPLYFAQDRVDLPEDKTVLEALIHDRHVTNSAARQYLARFLFRGDDVFKTIAMLSGGEKSRLSLARLMLTAGNLYLLDEPTNHLDIDTREAVQQAFIQHDATLIFVTHDRPLLEAWADVIWWVEDGSVRIMPDGYEQLLSTLEDRKHQTDESSDLRSKQPSASNELKKKRQLERQRREETEQKKRLAELERHITVVEEEKEFLETELSRPELYEEPANVEELAKRYATARERLAQLEEAWLEAVERLKG